MLTLIPPPLWLSKCINVHFKPPSHVGLGMMLRPVVGLAGHNSHSHALYGGPSKQLERWDERRRAELMSSVGLPERIASSLEQSKR